MPQEKKLVLIDGFSYGSITEASTFLDLPSIVLSTKLHAAAGKPIDIKGFKVEFANPKDADPVRHKQSVIVINTVSEQEQYYESMTAAAKALKVGLHIIMARVKDHKAIRGLYKVRLAKEEEILQVAEDSVKHSVKPSVIDKPAKKGIEITSSDGKTFKSITQLADYLRMNVATLTQRFYRDGKYTANNIVYTKLTPIKQEIKETIKEEVQVIQPEPKSNISGVELARNLLKDKLTDYIKNDNFAIAKELMDVIEQIKE